MGDLAANEGRGPFLLTLSTAGRGAGVLNFEEAVDATAWPPPKKVRPDNTGWEQTKGQIFKLIMKSLKSCRLELIKYSSYTKFTFFLNLIREGKGERSFHPQMP